MLESKKLLYDERYLKELFTAAKDYYQIIYSKKGGDCVKSYLPKIRCPTLLIELQLDYFCEKIQSDIMKQEIKSLVK
uniref:Uncharacterized protein n=1 Tax=Romanomermis culicivorax TaxID=13658 RepID=A0A915JRJ4_ROMCU